MQLIALTPAQFLRDRVFTIVGTKIPAPEKQPQIIAIILSGGDHERVEPIARFLAGDDTAFDPKMTRGWHEALQRIDPLAHRLHKSDLRRAIGRLHPANTGARTVKIRRRSNTLPCNFGDTLAAIAGSRKKPHLLRLAKHINICAAQMRSDIKVDAATLKKYCNGQTPSTDAARLLNLPNSWIAQDRRHLLPLLKIYANPAIWGLPADGGRDERLALFRRVAFEIISKLRTELKISQEKLIQLLQTPPEGVTVSIKVTGTDKRKKNNLVANNIRVFDRQENQGNERFAGIITSTCDVLGLDAKRPDEARLLRLLAKEIHSYCK